MLLVSIIPLVSAGNNDNPEDRIQKTGDSTKTAEVRESGYQAVDIRVSEYQETSSFTIDDLRFMIY